MASLTPARPYIPAQSNARMMKSKKPKCHHKNGDGTQVLNFTISIVKKWGLSDRKKRKFPVF
jgi:hypothetical protein